MLAEEGVEREEGVEGVEEEGEEKRKEEKVIVYRDKFDGGWR